MLPIKDNNPTSTTPWVTWGLIAVNVVVFLATLPLGQHALVRINVEYGAIPAVLFGNIALPPQLAAFPPGWEFLTVFTAMFLHGGWLHIGGNMLYLWVFGNNVEDSMGHFRFLVFYFLCGLAAGYGHALADTNSQIPMIGASGALAGVLGAYFLLFPKARILVWFFWILIFYVPAVVVLGFWIGMQVLNLSSGVQDGVAWAAHVAGFFAGMALIPFFKYRHVPLWQGAPKREPVFGVYRPGRRNNGPTTTPPPWAEAYERERAERRANRNPGGPWAKSSPQNDPGSPWGRRPEPPRRSGIGVPHVRRNPSPKDDDGLDT